MNQGFTLIELLVVVLIIGILSAVALPQYNTAVERSRATEALTQLRAISDAAQRYHSQHEQWPGTFNQLDIDVPALSDCDSNYGGKNFCFSMSNDCAGTFCATASRRLTSSAYNLISYVGENASTGTYTVTRTCSPGSDDTSKQYCKAITGGHNDDF